MPVNVANARQCLKAFDFTRLFVEELGWDCHSGVLDVEVEGQRFSLVGVAQKRGLAVLQCKPANGGQIPDYPTRRKIDHQVTKSAREHLTVYTDAARTTQVWQWVKRELGKPTASREHTYHRDQPGDGLIQKLSAIAFSLDEEADLTLVDVVGRVRSGLDIERVTKRFYEVFKAEHDKFSKFIKGLDQVEAAEHYGMVMLNRLMFIYFIQKKGFLGLPGDENYLRNKLEASKGKDRYYRDFLCPLFFEGFAKQEGERDAAINTLLGKVPYLNGGLFLRHQIEEDHGQAIQIPDAAFERLFGFFEQYHWHLDERPLRQDNEINPDVLGYIFEKYINQKQMGAYYTKEDITGYISRNTVLPFLFDAARAKCKVAFEGLQSVWGLLSSDPDRYIYSAVRRGVIDENGQVTPESALPEFVRKGMADPKARMFNRDYNLGLARIYPSPSGRGQGEGASASPSLSTGEVPASAGGGGERENLALPTETWREYVERRKRCLELRDKLARGEVRNVNDLITLNLDIQQFAQDVIQDCEGPELLRAFWRAIVGHIKEKSNEETTHGITVLDPTCGSGAFLFAALNILEPLYEACLDRMQAFVDELDRSPEKHRPEKFADFRRTLAEVARHPNRKYFIYKSIVVNNLFGVDIMAEAVEICKLRLFLKLVAQVDDVRHVEPLPDIDFNIRAGNTLVGYAGVESLRHALESEQSGQIKLVFDSATDSLGKIEEQALQVGLVFETFRLMQTREGMGSESFARTKATLRQRLGVLTAELDRHLAAEYDISPDKIKNEKKRDEAFAAWRVSHQPFHWLAEFYGIIKRGGFDVIIGNPPYVASRKVAREYTVRNYRTTACPDIYAWCLERVASLVSAQGRSGMIVPLSLGFSADFDPMRKLLYECYGENWFSSFGRIPSALFNYDVRVRNTIHVGSKRGGDCQHTTQLHRWFEDERPHLLSLLEYAPFNPTLWAYRIPKLRTPRLSTWLEGLLKNAKSRVQDALVAGPRPHALHFKKTAYNWLAFSPKPAPCFDERGREIEQSQSDVLFVRDKSLWAPTFLLLNGKLLYVYWCIVGDDFHVTRWNFSEFPIDMEVLAKRYASELADKAAALRGAMQDAVTFKLNAGKRVGNYNMALCREITDIADQLVLRLIGSDCAWDEIENYYSAVMKTNFEDDDDG